MMQLINRVGTTMKQDFTAWLSNAVELDEMGEGGDASSAAGDARIEERRLALLMRTARHSVQANARHARAIETVNQTMSVLIDENAENRAVLKQVARSLRSLSEENQVVHSALSRSVEAFHAVAHATNTRSEIAELTSLVRSHRDIHEERMDDRLENIHKRIAELQEPSLVVPSDFEEEADELVRQLAEHADELDLKKINQLLSDVYGAQEATDAEKADGTPSDKSTGTEG